jgi:hypothetical protein
MPQTQTSVRYKSTGFSAKDGIYFKQSMRAFADAGLSLKPSDDYDVLVHLTTHKEMKRLYPSVANAQLSVTDRGKDPMQIHINAENWERVPTHLGSDFKSLDEYRTALLSHEFAHAFGHDHVTCACVGCPWDVRQQPSRSLGGCKPNNKVYFNSKSPHTNRNI